MQTHHAQELQGASSSEERPFLTAQELLAGSLITYDIDVPGCVLRPDGQAADGRVRIRPLRVATLALISRAAKDDPSLVPLLMVKESLVDPVLGMNQIRMFNVGMLQFLVSAINRISGLDAESVQLASTSTIGDAHLLLARHFGWTPAQVSELTPGQVAVYLAGVERLLSLDAARKGAP